MSCWILNISIQSPSSTIVSASSTVVLSVNIPPIRRTGAGFKLWLPTAIQDDPLPPIQQLAGSVQVTRMAGGLSYHMHDDLSQVVQSPRTEQVVGPGCRSGV